MKRRLAALFLILTILGGAPAYGNEDLYSFGEKALSRLLTLTPSQRADFLTLSKTMVVTDSGVDFLIDSVLKYQPGTGGMIEPLIAALLSSMTASQAAALLSSLKIVPEDIRYSYYSDFQQRKTRALPPDALEDLEYFLRQAGEKFPSLSRLLSEDGITPSVIAHMLGLVLDLNDGLPLLTDALPGSDDFAAGEISKLLLENVRAYLSENHLSFTGTEVHTYMQALNNRLSGDEKKRIKNIGAGIGFYTPLVSVIASDASGGTLYSDAAAQSAIEYRFASAQEAGISSDATVVKVFYRQKGSGEEGALEGLDQTVAFPVNTERVMAYRVDNGALVPVKYNVQKDGQLYVLIEKTGYYAFKSMPLYFSDADGWGGAYIESLYRRGIVSGKGEGVFEPEASVTREEFAKLITELFSLSGEGQAVAFEDTSADQWHYPYIAAAFRHKVASGMSETRFGVGEPIIRQDICKMIAGALNGQGLGHPSGSAPGSFADEAQISDYARESVAMMRALGIVSGNPEGFFLPADKATRQEAAKIIHGVLEYYILSRLK